MKIPKGKLIDPAFTSSINNLCNAEMPKSICQKILLLTQYLQEEERNLQKRLEEKEKRTDFGGPEIENILKEPLEIPFPKITLPENVWRKPVDVLATQELFC